jgi:ATP-dependent helicase Lhr and Lhr-like helicase
MIGFKEKPSSDEELLHLLHPLVKEWFFSRFESFSLPQRFAVVDIHSRKNVLVSAPTGATKTLTGFLSILNELVDSSIKGILQDKVYCIYVSPLKALNYDIEVNLLRPLKEMEELHGSPLGIRIATRTGDTTAKEKQGMLKKPPHILITTPESLAIMLASKRFKTYLISVDWCIIDEIHALAENKRGVHLSLTLELLSHISPHLTRVGLSATISPLDKIAHYLVGKDRPCTIIDVTFMKDLDLKVLCPVKNLIDVTYGELHNAQYNLLHDLIQKHQTTLIFTNTRAGAERVVHFLKEKFPQEYTGSNIGAHHGSLSKEVRHHIESNLRDGKFKVVVSSTSLELGIDIGYIDLVILLGSPKSVARALQRCGRSGHQLNKVAKGRLVVLDRDDLVECSVLLKNAKEHKIDTINIPHLCLDVLSQQIIGIVLSEPMTITELYNLITKSYSFSELSYGEFMDVIKFLSGEYTSLEERYVYAKIWISEDGIVRARGKMGRVIYMTNIGTIPDETHITVKLGEQVLGSIDEGFLEKLKPGDVFVLGGQTYEFRYARGMVMQVKGTVDRPPTVPRWFSEMLPLSFDLAMDISRFRRLIREKLEKGRSRDEIVSFIHDYVYVDDNAAEAIYNYMEEQYKYLIIPHDKEIVIECYDDGSQIYYLFHSLFGRRVNDCLSRAIAFVIARTEHRDTEVGINDNGFYITSSKRINIRRALSFLLSEKFTLLLNSALESSEVLRRRFRHAAGRSFMILRNYKGKQKRVGRQQVSSQILINAVKRISNDFPILKESRREVLEDLMDIKNTKIILRSLESGSMNIVEKSTAIPSPFAFNLILQGFSDIIKIEDRQTFLMRMHESVLWKIDKKENSSILDLSQKQDVAPLNLKDFIRKFPKESLTMEQRRIIKLILRLDIAESEKTVLIDFIKGNKDPDVFEEIRNKKEEIILKWPKELSVYLIRMAEEGFSYTDFWEKESEKENFEKIRKTEELKKDLLFAARRLNLTPDLYENLLNTIDDPKNLSSESKQFIDELLRGTIPKQWSDNLIKYFRKVIRIFV